MNSTEQVPRLSSDPGELFFAEPDFALQPSRVWRMQQGWRDSPEEGFRAGRVELAWCHDRLWLHAVLEDDDIHTSAVADDQRFWERGDVLEIFVRRLPEAAYREFQVTPNGHRLQLAYPGAEEYRALAAAGPYDLDPFITRGRDFDFFVRVESALGRWRVLAAVPGMATGMAAGESLAGELWRLSVSRYDYARGNRAPVLSSTSAFSRPAFHDQSAWKTVVFSQTSGGAGSK